jgi:hypothetical protein
VVEPFAGVIYFDPHDGVSHTGEMTRILEETRSAIIQVGGEIISVSHSLYKVPT